MSYTKHNFASGDILAAADLNEMDDQIAANELTLIPINISYSNYAYTVTSSWTKAQVEAVWPNCIVVVQVGSNTDRTYAVPLFKDSNQCQFMGWAGSYRRQIKVTSSGWTCLMNEELVNARPSEKILVIGDSMCSAYGTATTPWPSLLNRSLDNTFINTSIDVRNAAVSGACFGSYSLSSATSLLAQLNANSTFVSSGTPIVCVCSCYNDVKAAENGTNVNYSGVLTAAKAVFDRIRALNANARIVYLSYCNGLITDSSGYETGWYNRCRPMDCALRAMCSSEGIQVIDLTSGSGYNATMVQSDYKHPTNAGHNAIGRAMRHKLIDRCTTMPPDTSVTLDFGQATNAGINPYKYDFPFIQTLYSKYGIDVKIRLWAVTGYDCLGVIQYCSNPSATNQFVMWKSEALSATTLYNPTTSNSMTRYSTYLDASRCTCKQIHDS